MMTIVESILTKNKCYKTKRTIVPKGLMLHSVGCPQPSAKVFVHNWNTEGIEKCVHGFIDANDGTVYQTLPWNHRGWHAGGSANNTHIGVEMCEPSQIKYTGGATFTIVGDKAKALEAAERTYHSAVELFAQLCVKYNLDPLKNIISHKEGHTLGVASNHGDPEHLWKQLGMSYTMDTFRSAVAEEVAKVKDTSGIPTAPSEPPQQTTTPESEFPKKVRIVYDNLRIRKGPGTNYATTGSYTGKGIFTITEIQNGTGSKTGWGKLKSGAGWIAMDYAVIL